MELLRREQLRADVGDDEIEEPNYEQEFEDFYCMGDPDELDED
jgi:hypothetical protein